MLTMKQMIRQLHISKPISNTMSLLGKKYPINESDFRISGLIGDFESNRAGKKNEITNTRNMGNFTFCKRK